MKKFLLLISAATALVSCNKAGDNEYIVTGTIKGIENGKTVTLEVQNEMGQLTPVDTVKIQDGKFTFEGNAKEPKIYLIQVEKVEGKIPFILENGDISMVINKDSLNNTKITGTYNNEELTSFKENGMKIQKKMMKFQTDNMAKMNQAQQTQDTVVMNSLRKEYSKFQEEFVKQSEDYLKDHPKSYISALIIEGMFNQMSPDVAKIKGYYNGLDKSLKGTATGISIKNKIDLMEKPKAIAPPPPPMPAQSAAPAAGNAK